jgi:hypothetical protein
VTPFGARLVGASALVVLCGGAPGWATRSDDPVLSPTRFVSSSSPRKSSSTKTWAKGIDVTFSIAPPLPAGTISGASTGGGSMPSYMGREPRHWWTINTDSGPIILRVSPKVYDQLKAGVAEHNVKIQESPAKKKK